MKALIGYGNSNNAHTGNRLEVSSFGNEATIGIANFDLIEFNVPGTSTLSMLTLSTAGAGDISDITSIKTSLKAGGNFATGDRINLITCTNCTLTLSPNLEKTKGYDYTEDADHVITEGVSLAWNFEYGEDDKNLYITIGESTDPGSRNPSTPTTPSNPTSGATQLRAQTKSLVETQLASATLIRHGSDLLARSGFEAAVDALEAPYSGTTGFTPFVALGAAKLRHETSSHVDIKGASASFGLASETANRLGKLILAPVVEYGYGDYDSYIDNGIHGEGSTQYWGAGLALRQTLGEGFYVDASARYGRVESDYASNDLDGASHLKYDLHTNYVALHTAAGKTFAINDHQTAELYTRYFYDRQQAASTTLSSGENYRFSSVDGHRVQLGGKYSFHIAETSSLYVDALWQHEFSSEASATYKGLSTPLATMKGSSGSFSLGWHKDASASSPWFVDLQGSAWTGKQQLFSAQFAVGYKF